MLVRGSLGENAFNAVYKKYKTEVDKELDMLRQGKATVFAKRT